MEWAHNHPYPLNYLMLLLDPEPNILDKKEPEAEVIDPLTPEPESQPIPADEPAIEEDMHGVENRERAPDQYR